MQIGLGIDHDQRIVIELISDGIVEEVHASPFDVVDAECKVGVLVEHHHRVLKLADPLLLGDEDGGGI